MDASGSNACTIFHFKYMYMCVATLNKHIATRRDKPNLHSVACKHVGVIYIHAMRAVTTLPQYLGIITQHTKPAVIFTYLHLSKPWNC